MEVCPNCGKVLTEEEKIIYKCMSCKQQFKHEDTEYVKHNNSSNTKKSLCKFLIGLFCVIFIICLFTHIGSKSEYVIAKGDVALKKVNALQSNIWNLNPNVDTSELDKIVLKRNICMAGMIISVVGVIVCCIILYGEKNTPIVTNSQNNSHLTQTKLKELEQIYKNDLITQEEYESKRKEIINKF